MATPNGLVVPTIKKVQSLSILEVIFFVTCGLYNLIFWMLCLLSIFRHQFEFNVKQSYWLIYNLFIFSFNIQR